MSKHNPCPFEPGSFVYGKSVRAFQSRSRCDDPKPRYSRSEPPCAAQNRFGKPCRGFNVREHEGRFLCDIHHPDGIETRAAFYAKLAADRAAFAARPPKPSGKILEFKPVEVSNPEVLRRMKLRAG